MFISVVVTYYNRLHLLRTLMESLYAQDYPASKFEILLIDGGSSTTPFQYPWRKNGPKVMTFRLAKNSGAAGGRNLGILIARGEVIAFTDSDARPERTWLSEIARVFETSSADAASGKILTDFDASISPTKSIVTCNAACRRRVLLDLGLFDERFWPLWHEDTDLGLRLTSAGYRLQYNDKMIVYNPHKPVTPRFLWNQMHFRMNDVLLYRKHKHAVGPLLQLIAPGITISGAEALLSSFFVLGYFLLLPLNLAIVAAALTFATLTILAAAFLPSLRGRNARGRLKPAIQYAAWAFAITLGHIAGSVKFRTFLI